MHLLCRSAQQVCILLIFSYLQKFAPFRTLQERAACMKLSPGSLCVVQDRMHDVIKNTLCKVLF